MSCSDKLIHTEMKCEEIPIQWAVAIEKNGGIFHVIITDEQLKKPSLIDPYNLTVCLKSYPTKKTTIYKKDIIAALNK